MHQSHADLPKPDSSSGPSTARNTSWSYVADAKGAIKQRGEHFLVPTFPAEEGLIIHGDS